MKILIDESLPRRLKCELPDDVVFTVPEKDWAGKKNGDTRYNQNEQRRVIWRLPQPIF
jgi:hypothetical protein